ncbi:unnamed protein product, partial [Sphacelaria rigidula]
YTRGSKATPIEKRSNTLLVDRIARYRKGMSTSADRSIETNRDIRSSRCGPRDEVERLYSMLYACSKRGTDADHEHEYCVEHPIL